MGESILERLKDILDLHFGHSRQALRPEATLRGALMLDCLDLADLVTLIDHEFGVEPPLEAFDSLGGLAALIERQMDPP
ncbi:acyl carrier protein [Myxococcota bacterium]|nr:acyl carrier protein [Myxococcota bacterium]MBU1432313.1 acyl carrier protein [Myxococcota bacterium]MBU1897571.1 acyl carrier protein [Myxococcota bacterium]